MKWLTTLALSLALGLAALPALEAQAVAADPAVARIEAFNAALVDTMKRGPALGMHGRYEAMTPVVDATFDIPTMIKFIVGTGWASMSEEDHQALTEAFRRMTIANYACNFDKFDGERFVVDPTAQTKGSDRFVTSTLTPEGNKPIPFIYRMRDTGDGWKVIDILLNGYVSELATRRSDFASTLAGGGAPALVKKLNGMTDDLLAGTKTKAQ